MRRSTLVNYGIGAVAFGIKDNGFNFFLLLYYNQVLGLRAELASAAIFAALLLDAASDPIVGNWSDHLRSRWGRRHPFMYAAAVPVAVSYYFLWNPPALSEAGLFWYLLGVAVLVRTFITLYEVPSTALAPELTSDYDERTRLASVRHFFGWAGGIGIAVFTYLVLFKTTPEHAVGQLNPDGYRAYGIWASIFMFAAIVISAAGTHSHIPRLTVPAHAEGRTVGTAIRELRDTLWNRSFAAVFGYGIFSAAAAGLAGALNIYVNTYFWELAADQIGLLVPSGLISAVIALFAAPAAARRLGKKRAAVGISLCAASVAPLPFIARFAGAMPENGTTALLGLLIIYNVAWVALIISGTTLVSAMVADIVEESELLTGRRSEGAFFAARSFIAKSLAGVGVVLGTVVLSVIHFPANATPGEVPADIIRNLGLAYAPALVLLNLGAITCLSGYSISREQHEANLARLRDSER